MIRRVHLVYPHGPAISCPDTIGRHLAAQLREQYDVVLHDWDAAYAIEPRPGDALVGHPHPIPWTVFRRSSRRRGWERVVVLFPFHHADGAEQVAFVDPVIRRANLALAITGRRWFETVEHSPVAAWAPKLVHVDLAIDRDEFPPLKQAFAPPGRRRLLYVGHSHWTKNPEYLAAIAADLGDVEFGWIGGGPPIRGLVAHGPRDFRTDAARDLVASHDIFVTASRADANPCTVLEAMAWGLVPACTPGSGYDARDGVVELPPNDAASAASVLRTWIDAPADEVERRQTQNLRRVAEHYTWERFASQVRDALESDASPAIVAGSRARLLARSLTSRHSPLRPHYVRSAIRSIL